MFQGKASAGDRPEQSVVDEIDALVDWQLAQGESVQSVRLLNVAVVGETVTWRVPKGRTGSFSIAGTVKLDARLAGQSA